MKKFLAIVASLTLSSFVYASITIKGQLGTGHDGSVTLGYWNKFSFTEKKIAVNNSGFFTTTLPADNPMYIRLSCIKNQPFLLLFPGDEIQISFSKNNIQLSGSAGRYNQFKLKLLNEIDLLRQNRSAIDYFEFATNQSDSFFATFQHANKDAITRMNTGFIASYCMLNDFLVNNSVNKPNISALETVFRNTDTPTQFNSRFRQIRFNDSILQYDPFYLNNIFNFLRITRYLSTGGNIASEPFIVERDLALNIFGNNPFTTGVIAYNLHYRLSNFQEYSMKLLNAREFLEDFALLPQSGKYMNLLNKVYQGQINKAQLIEAGNDAPPIKQKDLDGRIIDLKELRGRVVYLDFWASWCKPCIKQSKELKNLQSRFPDSLFSIVSISIDDDSAAWKKAISDHSIPGRHINIPSSSRNETALQDYNIYGVPRFVLIDKRGKIVRADAPLPSDPALIGIIEREVYLHQKQGVRKLNQPY